MHEANEVVIIKTPKIRCFVNRIDKSYIIAGLEGAPFETRSPLMGSCRNLVCAVFG